MRKQTLKWLLLNVLVAMALHVSLSAQCSDAGACSIGKPHAADSDQLSNFTEIQYSIGASGKEEQVSFRSIRLSTYHELTRELSISGSIPLNNQSGLSADVTGIGDLIALFGYSLVKESDAFFSIEVGARVKVGSDNKGNFAQIYQSSLGTNDLLLGVGYGFDQWRFSVGYQHPFNRNTNISELKRGDDVLLKIQRTIEIGNDFQLRPELLVNKRIGLSSILPPPPSTEPTPVPQTEKITIPQSDPFQINFALSMKYRLNEALAVSGFAAIPFLKREVNVDGLTRVYSVAVGLELGW